MDTKLVMPNSYAVVDTEEMEYIDGGGNIISSLFDIILNGPSIPRVLSILGYISTDEVISSSITKSIVSGIKNFTSTIWGGFSGTT